jgi:REP element-mobilizing transposase RayT
MPSTIPTNAHDRRRLTRFREPGAAYFLTWRLAADQPPLAAEERTLIAESLQCFDGVRYHLFAWVVMDDHVHVVVLPVAPTTLDAIAHNWRSFMAGELCRRFGRRPPVWTRGGHDRAVWAGGELEEKASYVVRNPWRRWPDCSRYSWVWPVEDRIRS